MTELHRVTVSKVQRRVKFSDPMAVIQFKVQRCHANRIWRSLPSNGMNRSADAGERCNDGEQPPKQGARRTVDVQRRRQRFSRVSLPPERFSCRLASASRARGAEAPAGSGSRAHRPCLHGA